MEEAFRFGPRSHRVFYYSNQTRNLRDDTEQYANNLAYFKHNTPIDCHGRAGDVVFWHHRLAHSAGSNRSKGIRKAVLGDYVKKNIERTMNEPPCEDMWEGMARNPLGWESVTGQSDIAKRPKNHGTSIYLP